MLISPPSAGKSPGKAHYLHRDGEAPHPGVPPHLQGAATLMQPNHEGHHALSSALGQRRAGSRAQGQVHSLDQAPCTKEVPAHHDHNLRLLALHRHGVQWGSSLELGNIHPCPGGGLGEGRDAGPAPRGAPPHPQDPRVPLGQTPRTVRSYFNQHPAEQSCTQPASRPHPDPSKTSSQRRCRSGTFYSSTPSSPSPDGTHLGSPGQWDPAGTIPPSQGTEGDSPATVCPVSLCLVCLGWHQPPSPQWPTGHKPVSFCCRRWSQFWPPTCQGLSQTPTNISSLVSFTTSASAVPQNPGPGAPLEVSRSEMERTLTAKPSWALARWC